MAMLHAEGFAIPRSGLYSTALGNGFVSTSGRNNGVDTWGLNSQTGFSNVGVRLTLANVGGGTPATIVTGFALFIPSGVSSGTHRVCELIGTSNTHLSFEFDFATLKLSVYRGQAVTLLGTTSAGIVAVGGEWVYLEVKATIDDTVGSVEVRAYGSSLLSLSGIDTRNADIAGVAQIHLGHNTGAATSVLSFDDWYICDTTGSINNTFLATTTNNIRIFDVAPNAAGDSTQFTPNTGTNFAAAASWDDDTTYVADSTVGHRDLYNLADTPSGAANIAGVMVSYRARKDDATARSLALGLKSGGTIFDQTAVGLTNAYVTTNQMFESDPATSAPWTKTAVDALQLGPKVAA